jgi:hypothetical protein
VVYRAVTDKAVVNWYLKNMAPRLDLPNCRDLGEVNEMFIKSYDTYRFLRAFERTGSLYYLLLNAKALMLQGNKEFYPLFNTIARGMIFTGEPGLLQGPALLGGVYSSPQTMTKFLELLVLMAKDKRIASSPVIEVKAAGKTEKITLGEGMKIMDLAGPVTVKAPAFVTVRVNDSREINMYDYLRRKAFFRAALSADELSMGDEADLVVELDGERDPSEYYAVIGLPSVLSVKQTEDILSDYKGQILYGQKAAGGEKITLVTVPFRGSRKMIIRAEAFLKGTSAGFVLVRHIANPDVIATVKTGRVRVK